MYQPGKLNPLIIQAQMNGDKEVERHLKLAQAAMDLCTHINSAHRNVKLGWRNKCNDTLSLEDIL